MDEALFSAAVTPLEEEFFSDALPRVQELVELKILLYVRHLAARRSRPGVSVEDLLEPAVLRATVGLFSPEPAELRLQRALDRAVANGFLLRATVRSNGRATTYLLPATRANRELVEDLERHGSGAVQALALSPGAEATVSRPNIFAFYEQHVGPLTPLVAEQLRDAERSYPRAWIEEAVLTAVHYNKRTWRYIQTILSRWEETGGPDAVSRHRP
jgi:DnaD/phage-associated family protein